MSGMSYWGSGRENLRIGISRSGDADPSTGLDRAGEEVISSTSAANVTVAAVRLAFSAGDAETGARWSRRSSLESASAERRVWAFIMVNQAAAEAWLVKRVSLCMTGPRKDM